VAEETKERGGDGARSAPPAVRQALRRLAAALRERWGEDLLEFRLFGSHARGEAHEESDVDVCVVLRHAGWTERRDVIDLATDVGLTFDLRLSPTVFDASSWERWQRQERPLAMDVEREGVPL